MDKPLLANPQEINYIRYVRTKGVFWKTFQDWWIKRTGVERESGSEHLDHKDGDEQGKNN